MTDNPAELSPVGFGAWQAGGGATWGPHASDADVVRAVQAAYDSGVTWIDTAAAWGGGGGSERLVGEALRSCPDLKVCTKVTPSTVAGLRAALTGSLRRLGRDRIDVYLLHRPAARTADLTGPDRRSDPPIETAWAALTALKAEGLAGAIGLSGFPAADVATCAATGELDYVQLQASVLYRDELDTYGPLCARDNVGIMTFGALSFGLLTGAIHTGTAFDDWRGGAVRNDDPFCADNYARFFAEDVRPGHLAVIARLRRLAGELGISPARLALAWILAQPHVTATLAGTRNAAHARDNALAATTILSPDIRDSIAAVVARAHA